MPIRYVRMKGLETGRMYRDEASGREYPADVLMQIGWPIPAVLGEYHAYRLHLVRV